MAINEAIRLSFIHRFDPKLWRDAKVAHSLFSTRSNRFHPHPSLFRLAPLFALFRFLVTELIYCSLL